MITFSLGVIEKSCKLLRTYFPAFFILEKFKDVSGKSNLESFPELKKNEEYILKAKKGGVKLSITGARELSEFFQENQDLFILFLKSMVKESFESTIVSKIVLDEFISQVNILLLKDAKIKIENYEVFLQLVPNMAKQEIFLNLNVPEVVIDYFREGLDCSAYQLHRSSILFCTFALEASLRHKYAKKENGAKAESIKFVELINWAIRNRLIEENEFNKINIDFIRKYRNELAHLSSSSTPESQKKISRERAKRIVPIIIHLVRSFIDDIFYK